MDRTRGAIAGKAGSIKRVRARLLIRTNAAWRRVSRILFPSIPDRFEPRSFPSAATRREAYHLSRYAQYLEALQASETDSAGTVQLSYSPIAKNIRRVGTALYENARRGRKTVIVAGNKKERERLMREGRGDWEPWLWSRIPRGQLHNVGTGTDDTALGWPCYFFPLIPELDGPPPAVQAPVWRGRIRTGRILEVAACTRYAFRLNQRMQDMVESHADKLGWPVDERVLGVHIRRGDASSEDLRKQNRPSFSLEAYLACADRLCTAHGIRTLYLSTESELELQRAKELRPRYRILHLEHDREIFPKISETPMFIEHLALQDPSVIEPIINSAVADLYFMMKSWAFVGTFNSEFSVCAWLLSTGDHGHMIPYVNLAGRSTLNMQQGNLLFR